MAAGRPVVGSMAVGMAKRRHQGTSQSGVLLGQLGAGRGVALDRDSTKKTGRCTDSDLTAMRCALVGQLGSSAERY